MAKEIELERSASEMGFKAGRADIMKALHKPPPAIPNFAEEVNKQYATGQHFGFYTSWLDFAQIKRIYKGTYSEVYIAKCRYSRGKIVLKSYVLSKMGSNPQKNLKSRLGLMQEIMAPDKMENSSNDIVRCFGFFEEQGQIVFVLEYCARQDVMSYMRGRTAEEANVVIEIVQPVLRCMQHLHSKGITHGNLSPDNILLTADGYVKVTDFDSTVRMGKRTRAGLSPRESSLSPRLAGAPLSDQLTSTNRIQAPNLEFMSPELVDYHFPTASMSETGAAKRINPYDPSCDIWALGVMVYELLTGKLPFSEMDGKDGRELAFGTARLIQTADVSFPLVSRVSEEAVSFIKQAMQKNKNMRPSAEILMNHQWIQKYASVEVATMFVDDAPDYKQIPEHGVHDIVRKSAVGRFTSKVKDGFQRVVGKMSKAKVQSEPRSASDSGKHDDSSDKNDDSPGRGEDATIKAGNGASLPVRRRTLGGTAMPDHMDALLGFTAPEETSSDDSD